MCVRTLWGLFVPAFIVFTGFSARIRDWAERIGRKWFFALALYLVSFMAVNYLLEFPLSFFQGFVRQHAYGLSNQSFGRWFGHSLQRLGVGTAPCHGLLWDSYV